MLKNKVTNNLNPNEYPKELLEICKNISANFGDMFAISFPTYDYCYCLDLYVPQSEKRTSTLTLLCQEGKQLKWGVSGASRNDINPVICKFYNSPQEAFWKYIESYIEELKEIVGLLSSTKELEENIDLTDNNKLLNFIFNGKCKITESKNKEKSYFSYIDFNLFRISVNIIEKNCLHLCIYKKNEDNTFIIQHTFTAELEKELQDYNFLSLKLLFLVIKTLNGFERMQVFHSTLKP